jgi:acyl dehydratase
MATVPSYVRDPETLKCHSADTTKISKSVKSSGTGLAVRLRRPTIPGCLLTMNQNPLHIDGHYASQTQHGQRLVVGTLIFSIVVGLSVADISGRAIANLEYEEIKHLGPVFHGDTIYAKTRVLHKRESAGKPDRGIVYVQSSGLNQRAEIILALKRRILIPKRAASEMSFWPREGGKLPGAL